MPRFVTAPALAALLALLCAARASAADSSMDYGMVIDAGSTGSRLHLFKWPARSFDALPPALTVPVEEVSATNETDVPLATYPAGVTALHGLVAHAEIELSGQESRFGKFPIFLRATAGMRKQTRALREQVLAAARTYLHSSPFMFQDSFASVMAGEEEGVFGWLTVNKKMGTLEAASTRTSASSTASTSASASASASEGEGEGEGGGAMPVATWGALDMGGASTQITFQPDYDIMANEFNLQLGDAYFKNLYTHSFMYFGLNEARRRLFQACVDEALASNPKATSVDVPCLGRNYSVQFAALDGRLFTLTGTSQYQGCMDKVRSLLDLNATCWNSPGGFIASRAACSIGSTYQPPVVTPTGAPTGKFMAFSGYSYTWAFHKLPLSGSSVQDLQDKAQPWCGLSWDAQQKARPDVKPKYLHDYCFTSCYIEGLLGTGYRFPYNDKTILTVADPSDSSMGWTMGAIIFQANALGWTYEGSNGQEPWLTLFIVCLLGMLVAFSVIAYMLFHRKKEAEEGGYNAMGSTA